MLFFRLATYPSHSPVLQQAEPQAGTIAASGLGSAQGAAMAAALLWGTPVGAAARVVRVGQAPPAAVRDERTAEQQSSILASQCQGRRMATLLAVLVQAEEAPASAIPAHQRWPREAQVKQAGPQGRAVQEMVAQEMVAWTVGATVQHRQRASDPVYPRRAPQSLSG